MTKKFGIWLLVAAATTLVVTRSDDARAVVNASFPEDGSVHEVITTMAGLPVNASLFEQTAEPPASRGAIRVTITDCQLQDPFVGGPLLNPIDAALTEDPDGGISDVARFANNESGQATITFASDDPSLTDGGLLDGGDGSVQFFSKPQRTFNIGLAPKFLKCVGAANFVWVQVAAESDLESGPPDAGSDSFTVGVKPGGPINQNNAVPAVSGWGMAGLGSLLAGMGVALIRRPRRTRAPLDEDARS